MLIKQGFLLSWAIVVIVSRELVYAFSPLIHTGRSKTIKTPTERSITRFDKSKYEKPEDVTSLGYSRYGYYGGFGFNVGSTPVGTELTNIRNAYLNWCMRYGREPDERRFRVFAKNYREKESYEWKNKVKLDLTETADMSLDEYYRFGYRMGLNSYGYGGYYGNRWNNQRWNNMGYERYGYGGYNNMYGRMGYGGYGRYGYGRYNDGYGRMRYGGYGRYGHDRYDDGYGYGRMRYGGYGRYGYDGYDRYGYGYGRMGYGNRWNNDWRYGYDRYGYGYDGYDRYGYGGMYGRMRVGNRWDDDWRYGYDRYDNRFRSRFPTLYERERGPRVRVPPSYISGDEYSYGGRYRSGVNRFSRVFY